MILIKENQITHEPIVDVIQNLEILSDLKQAIEEYIIDNQQKTIIAGEPCSVFHVSGLAELHHQKLAKYLNRIIFINQQETAMVHKGMFGNYPLSHHWIQVDDLIIDVTIKQFSNKSINLNETLRTLLDHSCFICDNAKNPFYQLYSC